MACLILEVIHRHRYEKSRFLRGANIDEDKIIEVSPQTAQENAPNISYLHPKNTYFYFLDKVLSFDDTQETIFSSKPPLILVGSAGSGKTALTLEKLRRQLGQVLFITHSAYLVQLPEGYIFRMVLRTLNRNLCFYLIRNFSRPVACLVAKN